MPKSKKLIRQQLQSKVRDERLSAVREIKALPDKKALPLLEEGLTHWDRDLRYACLKQICKRTKKDSFPRIREMAEKGEISLVKALALASSVCTKKMIREVLAQAAENNPPTFVRALANTLRSHKKAQKIIEEQTVKARDEWVEAERQKEAKRAAKLALLDARALRNSLDPMDDTVGFLFAKWLQDHACFQKFYQASRIPKRHGGFREIHAPSPHLAHVQRLVLDKLLQSVALSDHCHGFRAQHSTATNAGPHVGQELVINLDLRDFFPTITAGRVRGLFKQLEFPGGEMGRDFLVDLVTYRGRLPQGAPTSPAIANLVCRRLDSRLAGLASSAKGKYTRYADDLTFSGSLDMRSILPKVQEIVVEEGFALAPEKTRLMRRGRRQDVTGLTVNSRVSIPRALRRRLRAAVHNAKHGKQASWKGEPMTIAQMRGHIAYLRQFHPAEAGVLLAALDGLDA